MVIFAQTTTKEGVIKHMKYDKYFITETPRNPDMPDNREKDNLVPWQNSLYISEELNGKVPKAYYLETNIVVRTGTIELLEKAHSHLFDEYLMFLGINPDNQFELGGEVEFWLGGEQHMITQTCAVFVPGGLLHCPIYFRRVDRPFMFITTGNTLGYKSESEPEARSNQDMELG
jgi:hypothetical protein